MPPNFGQTYRQQWPEHTTFPQTVNQLNVSVHVTVSPKRAAVDDGGRRKKRRRERTQKGFPFQHPKYGEFRAVKVVIYGEHQQGRVLIGEKKDTPGKMDLVGGKNEEADVGKEPWIKSLRREMKAESGLDMGECTLIGYHSKTLYFSMRLDERTQFKAGDDLRRLHWVDIRQVIEYNTKAKEHKKSSFVVAKGLDLHKAALRKRTRSDESETALPFNVEGPAYGHWNHNPLAREVKPSDEFPKSPQDRSIRTARTAMIVIPVAYSPRHINQRPDPSFAMS